MKLRALSIMDPGGAGDPLAHRHVAVVRVHRALRMTGHDTNPEDSTA